MSADHRLYSALADTVARYGERGRNETGHQQRAGERPAVLPMGDEEHDRAEGKDARQDDAPYAQSRRGKHERCGDIQPARRKPNAVRQVPVLVGVAHERRTDELRAANQPEDGCQCKCH